MGGGSDEAEEGGEDLFLAAMRANNVAPDSQTYTALMSMVARAARKNDKMVAKAWELLGEMQGLGLAVDRATCNALLNVCANAGTAERAQEVLQMMEAAGLAWDAYTYTAMMRLSPSAAEAAALLPERVRREVLR